MPWTVTRWKTAEREGLLAQILVSQFPARSSYEPGRAIKSLRSFECSRTRGPILPQCVAARGRAIQTNPPDSGGQIVFSNFPATNLQQFYRVAAPQD